MKVDVHLGAFLKKLISTFMNNTSLEIVSLGVWGPKEIIYHYDFISSSTLIFSMKFQTFSGFQIDKSVFTRVKVHFHPGENMFIYFK